VRMEVKALQPATRTPRVTKLALKSPWTVITKNPASGNFLPRLARADLDESPPCAGVRFTAAVQRSWGTRRPVNAGLLALSTLQGDVRRRLLGAWMESGGGTASFFAVEADSLLDFIAEQLPDPSPELAFCRVEQLTLRATHRASDFEAAVAAPFDPRRAVRRSCHAGLVLFPGGHDLILSKLLQFEPLPVRQGVVTPLLVAPGSRPLCRIASPVEHEIWTQLTHPMAVGALMQNGSPIESIETMLLVGALEYA
jgi:hypothetical protein